MLSSAIEAREEITTTRGIEKQAQNINDIERSTINKNTQTTE